MPNRVVVVGAGCAGLAASAYLGRQGQKVCVLEKHDQVGGRARMLRTNGFAFDMGPSWYWMRDVFERFYNDFGYSTSDFYVLKRLDPAFQVIFSDGHVMQVPGQWQALCDLFETYESGAADRLRKYLRKYEGLYGKVMDGMVYKPYLSVADFWDCRAMHSSLWLSLFSTVGATVRRRFKNPYLIQLLEFPVLFLGSSAQQIPALFNILNFAAFGLGTWYPLKGMNEIIHALKRISDEQHVQFELSTAVEQVVVRHDRVVGVETSRGFFAADVLISSADYVFTEQLLPPSFRNYGPAYWEKKVFAPSALIFYLGVNRQLPRLLHHNLFFEADFQTHMDAIYHQKQWPDKPLFYLSVPSKTDTDVAPAGCENLFLLIPVAPGLSDDAQHQERIFQQVMERIEVFVGVPVVPHIVVKKTYSVRNFIQDYHAYKGNAYGLATTLWQTATLRPKMRNKKIANLFYTGQLTVPGPGLPPAIISGKIVSQLVQKYLPQAS